MDFAVHVLPRSNRSDEVGAVRNLFLRKAASAVQAISTGFGSVANVPSSISVGSSGHERRIVNVATATFRNHSGEEDSGVMSMRRDLVLTFTLP